MNQNSHKRTARRRTVAGPDNYFITVSDIAIRVPKTTGEHIQIGHNEKFTLTRPDWRTLIFTRDPHGNVLSKHYKNTMMFYGRLLIAEKAIRLGRYYYCQEQTTEDKITFKYDPTWV